MISIKELDFVKAHEQFQRMCEFWTKHFPRANV